MRRLVSLAVVGGLAAGLGCGSGSSGVAPPPHPFFRPEASLRDVRVTGVGLGGGTLEVLLNVYNPNTYDLQQPRFTYRVLVDRSTIGRGVYDADLTIGAEDSVTVRLPLSFGYSGLGRTGRAMLSSGSVNYRIIGDIDFSTPHGRFRAPYDRAGLFSSLDAISTIPKR